MKLAGIILCGGASRRMGRDKAWLPWHGRPLLAHVVDVVGRVCERVMVAAGPRRGLPPLPDGVIVARDPSPHGGPLQGLAAALRCLPADVAGFFLTGCDCPRLSEKVVALLAELFARHATAIVPRV